MTSTTALDISCSTCGATVRVEAHLRTVRCPYCDSSSVVERKSSPERPDPVFVLPFVVDQKRAAEAVRLWISRRGPFVVSGFKQASIDKTSGVYLPSWLYAAVADSDYSAQVGENYTTVETYTTTVNGKTVVSTRVVTKTEWRSLQGRHSCYLRDILVTASAGLGNEELESIEPFDLRALRRYSPELLSGWIAEEPTGGREEAQTLSREEGRVEAARLLSAFMPGDSHVDLRASTSFRDEVTDLVLLPVWIFAARYASDKEPVRILVNGQTGEVQGKVPLSWKKITLAIFGGLALLAALGAGFALLAS